MRESFERASLSTSREPFRDSGPQRLKLQQNFPLAREIQMTLPRSVLIASDGDYSDLAQDPESVLLLDDVDAMVIPYSTNALSNVAETAMIRDVLQAAGQLVPGDLLIKNPYETARYELAEHAIDTFASAKYHVLANVARVLGAREVRFIEAKVDIGTRKWDADAKVKAPVAVVDANISNEVTDKLKQRLEGLMTFPGGTPAPEDALDYLRRRNLSNDQQLRDLIEMRTGVNPISSYKMTFSGTRESAANLKSALKIANSTPVKAVSIGPAFSRSAESISDIELTTEITF